MKKTLDKQVKIPYIISMKQQKGETKMKQGTRIYYNGDMANDDGFGTITKIEIDKWGTQIIISMDDGRSINVSPNSFSKEYKGHGGTRFVTEEAYRAWKEEKRRKK